MLTVIARAKKKVRIGGDQHSGWLPIGSAVPEKTDAQEVLLQFELHDDGAGYLLCYHSEDGALHGDTWHAAVEEAKLVAKEDFGVEESEWHQVTGCA